MNEFAIEWIKGRDWAGVTAPSHTRLKSRILKLAEQNPDEVQVLAENVDGSIFAHVSVKYIKISPPRKMSEEQKAAAAERMRKGRKKQEDYEDEWVEDDSDWNYVPEEPCPDEVETEEMDYDDWEGWV